MRIGIDARKIGDTGIGRHIENLIDNLLKIDDRNEYVIFLPPDQMNARSFPGERVTKVMERAGKYSLSEHWSLPLKARRHKLDLFHEPHYTLPLFTMCKSVVTIHDIIHLLDPSFGAMARGYAGFMIRRAVARAGAIITVSSCTKAGLVQLTGVAPSRVHVIPNGGGDFKRPDDESIQKLLAKRGVAPGYFIFVGSDRPHKNLAGVKKVMEIMRPDTRFVIVGRVGDEGKAMFEKYGSRAVLMNHVDKDDLQALYSGALALLFPSFHEGFGLPILEAMACGVPVVASDRSSIPEVAGDSAALIDPDDAQGMADALGKIRDDKQWADTLVQKGYDRARMFSWEKTARMTLDCYESVAS